MIRAHDELWRIFSVHNAKVQKNGILGKKLGL